MPAMQVERQHVGGRAVAAPLLEAWLDAGMAAGAVAVAAVENPSLEHPDRLAEAVLADVRDQVPELGAIDVHEREEGGGWVGVEVSELAAVGAIWSGRARAGGAARR